MRHPMPTATVPAQLRSFGCNAAAFLQNGLMSGNGMVRRCSCPTSKRSWQGTPKDKELAVSPTPNSVIAVIGIDIGKNSFHVVGHDARSAIVLRQNGREA